MTQLHTLGIDEIVTGLGNKTFSSLELTEHLLARIDSHDKNINSFITLSADLAKEQARQADTLRASGDVRPLLGVPMAHKDNLCTKGVLTTAGSKMLYNFVSPYNATLVDNVANAGFISLGKLNMDEFAMGWTMSIPTMGRCIILGTWGVYQGAHQAVVPLRCQQALSL